MSAIVVPIPVSAFEGEGPSGDTLVRARALHNPFAVTPLHKGVFGNEEDTTIRLLEDGRWELKPGRWMVSSHSEDGQVMIFIVEDHWDGIRMRKIER